MSLLCRNTGRQSTNKDQDSGLSHPSRRRPTAVRPDPAPIPVVTQRPDRHSQAPARDYERLLNPSIPSPPAGRLPALLTPPAGRPVRSYHSYMHGLHARLTSQKNHCIACFRLQESIHHRRCRRAPCCTLQGADTKRFSI